MNFTDNHQTLHSYGFYIFVWTGLLVLTGLTVAVAGIDLKSIATVTALAIAGIKSWFVVSYFMHLKDGERMFKLMFVFLLLVIVTVLILTFLDVNYR